MDPTLVGRLSTHEPRLNGTLFSLSSIHSLERACVYRSQVVVVVVVVCFVGGGTPETILVFHCSREKTQ